MESWTAAEIAAVQSRDKRRIWCLELRLEAATWRAAQTVRDVTDAAGRVWTGVGALGEVNGLGGALGRRPRELTVALHGIEKEQSLYARLAAADPRGRPVLVYMAWVSAAERLIVEPRLRFAGLVAANPVISLGDGSDRVTLSVVSGARRANRLAAPWDASPASHRAYVDAEDPIYDRVTTQTQSPVPL